MLKNQVIRIQIVKLGGNNRWSVSNIRQWLNSNGAAGSWWSAQHEYDAPPTSRNIYNGSDADAAYADAPGFLAGFSANVLQHFTDITNIIALCTADGGGSEETVDKVFLPSYTEIGFGSNNKIAEGSHLSVRYPDDNSRIKRIADGIYSDGIYWTRSPYTVIESSLVFCVLASGVSSDSSIMAFSGHGIAPIIVLH